MAINTSEIPYFGGMKIMITTYVGTKGTRALTNSRAMGYWLEEWHF